MPRGPALGARSAPSSLSMMVVTVRRDKLSHCRQTKACIESRLAPARTEVRNGSWSFSNSGRGVKLSVNILAGAGFAPRQGRALRM